MQFFLLLAGLEVPEPWEGLVQAAISAAGREMRPGAEPRDLRLCRYAAACANLQYRRMCAARGNRQGYAGKTNSASGDDPCAVAEALMRQYRKEAADLLTDDSFYFSCI